MEKFIKLSSTTEAMRAKNILRKYGIFSKVKKTTAGNSTSGCSFGIVISENNDKAIKILKEHGITPFGQASGDENDIF